MITMSVLLEEPGNLTSSHHTLIGPMLTDADFNQSGGANGSDVTMEATTGRLFDDIMGIWITGLLCILGFAGNVLSFLVLMRAFGRSPMFYVLRAVSLSDAMFLLKVFILQTLVNMYPHTGALEGCYNYRGYVQYALWPIMMMAQMSTVWLTVLVSAERYVAICFPLKAAALCTIPKVRRFVVVIFVVSILYNIPRYFEFEVVDNVYLSKTAIGNHALYRYLYACALYSLMLFFIPLLALVFLNLKLVLALQAGKKQWQSLQFRQKKEQNLTVIPLTIVLIFFICGTPALAVNVIDSIFPAVFNYAEFITFMVFSNLLVVFNSALNFVIYCMLGKKFRSKLLELCKCRGVFNYRAVHHLVSSGPHTGDCEK